MKHLLAFTMLSLILVNGILVAEERLPQRIVGINYPLLALQARRQGTVRVECQVDRDGHVQSVRTLSSSERPQGSSLLSQAAEDNAKKWRFAKRAGSAGTASTSAIVIIKYTFVLSGDESDRPRQQFVFEYPDSVTLTSEPPSVQP